MVYFLIKNNNKMKVKIELNDEQSSMLIDIIAQSQGVSTEEVEENLERYLITEVIDANREKLHLMEIDEEEVNEVFQEFLEEVEEE